MHMLPPALWDSWPSLQLGPRSYLFGKFRPGIGGPTDNFVLLPSSKSGRRAAGARSWNCGAEAGTLGNAIPRRRKPMAARIRHIALSVKDIDATADFYEKAFGLKRSPKSEGPTAYAST